MKKLLILLFSLFFLYSPSIFADDISDFSIEGINIGDSLLDFITKDEILEGIERTKNHYSYLQEPTKYADIYMRQNLLTYDFIVSAIKNNSTNKYITDNNEKYTVLSVRGHIRYVEDLDSCLQEKDKILETLSTMFSNTEKQDWERLSPLDPSGESIYYATTLYFDSGDEVKVFCTNWEESFRIKNNFSEGLTVELTSKEVVNWMENE